MSTAGPVVVVTGAARGGGRGVARAIVGRAATVVLVGRSTRERPNRLLPGSLEDTRDELEEMGVDAICMPADLAHPEQRNALCDFVVKELGRCDVLVNNAAYNVLTPFTDLPERTWQTIQEVNLAAPVALVRGLLPTMLAAGGGHIINVGSAAAVTDFGTQLAYAVSKAGLERFTTGLASELSGTGMNVNCVRVDEALRTEALEALVGAPQEDPGKGISPDEFGNAVRWISEQPPSCTGQVFTIQSLREQGALNQETRSHDC